MLPDLGPRYESILELGSGATARPLPVRDLHLGRELALKLFHDPPTSPGELEDAQREFALLAEIDHPGIARAHDLGYVSAPPFFTAEYIRGETLGALQRRMCPKELTCLARDLAEAIGSPANQATVLNNLGVVYSQCDRYREAIGTFREAERLILRRDAHAP